VRENPSKQIFLPQSGKKKGVFPYSKIAGIKPVFNRDNSANPLKGKQLALITALFWAYMEPLSLLSRGKIDRADSGKTDYQYR